MVRVMSSRPLVIPGMSLVVADPGEQARVFLTGRGNLAYDEYVASGVSPRHRIAREDVAVINTFMGGRSPYGDWAELLAARSISQLRRIDPTWNLFTTSERLWRDADVPARLLRLFERVTGPGIGISRATKLLHIKRPDLIPICDSNVVRTLGVRGDDAAAGVEVVGLLREQRTVLRPVLRELQRELRATDGIRRSLPRIADALIWGAEPPS